MDDQKNEFDDFEDEFFDDGFDELDDGLSDVNADSSNPDSFGDDWNFDENETGITKGDGKKPGKKSSNTLIIIIAVIIGFGVLVYQVMGDKLLGGNKFASNMSEQQNTDDAIGMTAGVDPVDLDALYESDSLGVEEFAEQQEQIAAQKPPMPAPVIVEESPLEETSSFMDDLEFSDYSSTGSQEQSMTLLQTPNNPQPSQIEQEMSVGAVSGASSSAENLSVPSAETINGTQSLMDPITSSQSPKVETAAQNAVATPSPTLESIGPVLNVEEIVVPEVTDNQKTASSALNTKDITDKLDTIIERLEKVEGTVSDIDLSPAQEIAALKQTIASLEKDIAQLKKAPVTKTRSTSAPSTTKKVVKAAVPKWELRAAQPGKAWVAKQGQKDIKSVSVGETLEGVGTIRSIELVSGRWVVKGSSSSIQQ